MKFIKVFDPALCCSTGVCGVDVDQALVSFSADCDWAKQNGAQIERFNLAQQPMAFAENATVKQALEKSGQETLPLTLVDGEVALAGRYPTRDELAKYAGLSPARSILNDQILELVAIGAAIASNCEPCFKYHYDQARKLGVSNADICSAVNIAQKVKEAPARAVLELAQRFLGQEVPAIKSGNSPKANPCCAPSAFTTAKAASKCC